jgi:hypothetical protein
MNASPDLPPIMMYEILPKYTVEMAPWRPARQKMNRPYVEAYLRHFPASEPVEDFDGRNALYAL